MTSSFDAIVIGSGISGGWAVKELCDEGLKTLLIERGRYVEHIKDYPTAQKNLWELPHRGFVTSEERLANPIITSHTIYDETTSQFLTKDTEHPYVQEKPFKWIRGYQLGGRSLLWGRGVQRWSQFEFDSPRRDAYGIEWPINYSDLAPWYSKVESFIGVSGKKEGLEVCPDGEYLPSWDMNCVEEYIAQSIETNYPNRPVIMGPCAHLTEPQEIHLKQGRGKCLARNRCWRGCPYGAYFSSNASTIPWALKTGNLTIKTDSIVHSIIYDQKTQKAIGVKVIDKQTNTSVDYYSKIIFVNASTLNTNLILLNSRSDRFPHGFGNDNNLLGKYVTNHNMRGVLLASFKGMSNQYYYGERPTSLLIPFFQNVRKRKEEFYGSYQIFFSANRQVNIRTPGIGSDLKKSLLNPGDWLVLMYMLGERVPREIDHVYLSKEKTDEWGIPQLVTSVDWDINDDLLTKDFLKQGKGMLSKAQCEVFAEIDGKNPPGAEIHEMGGVRMGTDPRTSLLNKWNQFHNCPNVFVTDGACMTSTGTKSPSLTYMALTARAVNFAVQEFKKGNF